MSSPKKLNKQVVRRIGLALFVLIYTLFASACGFHLRGKLSLAEGLAPIQVRDQNQSSLLRPALSQALAEADIPLAEEDTAKTVIVLSGEEFKKQLLSSSAGAAVQTYNLRYTVKFQLKWPGSAAGSQVDGVQTLDLQRALQFEKNAVLSSVAEEQAMRKEMLADAVHQILRRMRYQAPR